MNLLPCLLACLLAFVVAAPAWAQSGGPLAAVARVAVSVGQVQRVPVGGVPVVLRVDSELLPGDRVRTGPDAMAILVFSDEGRISLRPDSELLIRHYEIDPAGAKTRIELELIKGTVRQISGHASRAQPDRYRLNTPIAVIGVRGTDFLAKTQGDAVEAFVHEGNIVLVPRAEACASASNGCDPVAVASSQGGSRYVRLSAAGQVEHREFRPGELERVFGVDLARAGRNSAAGLASRSPGLDPGFQLPADAQFITETIFVSHGLGDLGVPVLEVSASKGSSAVTSAASSNLLAHPSPAPLPATSVVEPGPVSSGVVAVASAAAAAPIVASLPQQLVWGRFSTATALPANLLVPYGEASQGRHVTVGELGQYALWRNEPSGRLDVSLKGQADFSLAGAEAVLVQSSGVTAATVTRASLSVDFDRASFAAAVGLDHQATGAQQLEVSGKVNLEGVFVGTNATDRVAGALSRDGKEAGYLFSKDVSAGTFRGVTLWGRK